MLIGHPPGRWSFPVRSSDTDAHSQLHLSALFACMQEAAFLHLEQLDDLFGDFDALGLCWLLSRVSVRLDALPVWPEAIVVETRHRGLRRLTFVRDFTFRTSDGRLLGQAVSEWLVADQADHRPQRPDPAWLFTRPAETDDLPACPRLPSSGWTFSGPVLVRRACFSDIDKNHHVNNTRYVAWATDAVQAARQAGSRTILRLDVRAFDIHYQHEVSLGSELAFFAAPEPGRPLYWRVEARTEPQDEIVFRAGLLLAAANSEQL